MKDCLFCKIVKGEIDCAKVFENGDVLAFLDINPVSRGHCLVVPKKHSENIFDIDKDILQKVIVAAKEVAGKLKEKLNADGINILQSNGKPAGQIIFHFHLHVVPRYENDELKTSGFFGERAQSADIANLKKLALQLRLQ